MGIPTSVVIKMEKIIYPGTRICLVMSISRNPISANSTEGELRSPKARLFCLPGQYQPAFYIKQRDEQAHARADRMLKAGGNGIYHRIPEADIGYHNKK